MKKLAICAAGLAASLTIFAQAPQTYKGEIMDSQCAALGGHQVMAKQGESAKDCTNRCVSMGGRYTLYDPATKTAYQLDDAKKAATFRRCKSSGDRNVERNHQDDSCGQHQGCVVERPSGLFYLPGACPQQAPFQFRL